MKYDDDDEFNYGMLYLAYCIALGSIALGFLLGFIAIIMYHFFGVKLF
jgi:hypothetical protein